MKRAVLVVLLIPLVFFELFLCTAFLPFEWQHAIDKQIASILPTMHDDQSLITHPDMSGEIEDALRGSVKLKICFYFLVVLILVANAFFIRSIWGQTRSQRSVNVIRS